MSQQQALRTQVKQALAEAINKYGLEAAPRLVREKYPNIPKATWYRWLKELKAHPMSIAVAAARKAARHLPAAPSPHYIHERPAEARENIDILTHWQELYGDAEKMRAYSLTLDEEGGEQIRIPTFFGQSIKLRVELLETALRAMGQIWDLQRIQRLYDLILEEIGKVDSATQQRITQALRDLDEKVGIRMEAKP